MYEDGFQAAPAYLGAQARDDVEHARGQPRGGGDLPQL
jgi:hypothetical protein